MYFLRLVQILSVLYTIGLILSINILNAQAPNPGIVFSELKDCYQQLDMQCVSQKIDLLSNPSNRSQITDEQQIQLQCYRLLLAFANEDLSNLNLAMDALLKVANQIDLSKAPFLELPTSIQKQIQSAQANANALLASTLKVIETQKQIDQKKTEEQLKLAIQKSEEEKAKALEILSKKSQINATISHHFVPELALGLVQTLGLDQKRWDAGQYYHLNLTFERWQTLKNGLEELISRKKTFQWEINLAYALFNSKVIYLNTLDWYTLQLGGAFDLSQWQFSKHLALNFTLGIKLGAQSTINHGLLETPMHWGANLQGDFRMSLVHSKFALGIESALLQSFISDGNRIAWSLLPIYMVSIRLPTFW